MSQSKIPNKYTILFSYLQTTENIGMDKYDTLHLITDDLSYYRIYPFHDDTLSTWEISGINFIDWYIDAYKKDDTNLMPKQLSDKLIELREDKFNNLEM